MKNIILILTCLFLVSSCLNQRQESQDKRWLDEYNKALMTFSPDQIGHFPNDLTQLSIMKLHIYYPEATKYNYKAGLILNALADSIFYESLLKDLELKNIFNCSISNDSLIFIGDTVNDYSNILYGEPVPTFIDIKDRFGISNTRLNNREEVYIIESKQGEFLKIDNLVEGLKLPTNWLHGYSRGIVTDSLEYRLIYWLVIW